MKRKIVILGATGTVGSKIAENLLTDGHQVTLIARHIEKLETYRRLGANAIAADITDVETVTNAFSNADSAFVLLPDNVKAENTRAYQRQVTGKLIKAIERSGLKFVVNMSSVGSHMHEGNGMMSGTAEQEVRLNQLQDVNILHLRSSYFMENFLRTIGLVKKAGFNGAVADGDTAIPMVATRDVARIAAGHLADLDFKGKTVEAVMSPKNYTLREFTGIIGKAIGNPDLAYVQLPVEQARAAFLGNGFSVDFTDNLLEMGLAIQSGFMDYQSREQATIVQTSADTFATEVYARAYNT